MLEGGIAPVDSGVAVRTGHGEPTRVAWSEIAVIELTPKPTDAQDPSE